MAENHLNADARKENIRALMLAAGISEEEAGQRLDQQVLLTWDSADGVASQLAGEIEPILSRTVQVAQDLGDQAVPFAAELILGDASPRTEGKKLFAVLHPDRLTVNTDAVIAAQCAAPEFPLLTLIAACYATAGILNHAIGDGLINRAPVDFEIAFEDFLDPDFDLSQPVDIDEAYLAGAGALGNGFLWAARHADLHGVLHVPDDDTVSDGNLQRQIWFTKEDVGESKAETLCKKAQAFLPHCELKPAKCRLQEHPNRTNGAWLKRLIVAVDSRRARRQLQEELPGEVFDASTTGSQEIVLHYNKQPTTHACMSCIYHMDEAEIRHEEAVARHLGISVEAMALDRIGQETADQICAMHPQLKPENLMGLSFQSIYKQLCSSQQLKSASGQVVVAPFAFASVLAGALLLLGLMTRLQSTQSPAFNDWRINPWRPPVPGMKQLRKKIPGCECCGRAEIQGIFQVLWAA